jgi:iron complex transport system substrate-binding protein
MTQLRLLILLFLLMFASCSLKDGQKDQRKGTNLYAKGFTISGSDSVKKLEIFNPWENAKNIRFEYFLIPEGQNLPDSLKNRKVIRTPVKKVICTSTSHVAFLSVLGEARTIAGVSGGHYITNEKIRSAFDQGKIPDIGYGQNLNYEKILNIHPDLVLVYGIDSDVSGFVRKLDELGINTLIIGEYLESSPLGKTEWLKLIAALFGKENEAAEFFSSVESDYNLLKGKVRNCQSRPKVLVGIPYRDSWWVPGGKTYIANLIDDAGGDYPGKKNTGHESYVISFEDAMLWAENSDIWINTNSVTTKKEILDADPRFARFKVFTKGIIYNNNRLVTASGGNDFWESGTVYPNRILTDLIMIFHPEILSGNDFTYYKEIK